MAYGDRPAYQPDLGCSAPPRRSIMLAERLFQNREGESRAPGPTCRKKQLAGRVALPNARAPEQTLS